MPNTFPSQFEEIAERLRSILHAMSEVILSLSPEGELRYITPAAEPLLGIPLRDFSGGLEQLFRLVHPEDQLAVRQFYARLVEEEFAEMEYRIITPAGHRKWIHDEGHVAFCPGRQDQRIDHVLRDVTARRQAVDALARSEERYREFFHSTSDMAYEALPDGTIHDINTAGARLLGFCRREDVLGTNLRQFLNEPKIWEEIVAEIRAQGTVQSRHLRIKTHHEHLIEVDLSARAKCDSQGTLISVEGIIHNITQTLESQRNQVLRQAAGSVCHYLNTHIMHIMAAQDGILEELETLQKSAETEIIRGYCQDITHACTQMSAVTRAFNSAFLTYREEPYLDSAIVAIFNALQSEDSCPPSNLASSSSP